MPIYEYACVDCGRRIEVKQSFSDDQLTVCPNCEGRLRRVFHPVGVLFRGSGFYSTDHRKEQKAKDKPKPEEGAKAADTGGKKDGKVESSSRDTSKPAAKTTEKKD